MVKAHGLNKEESLVHTKKKATVHISKKIISILNSI